MSKSLTEIANNHMDNCTCQEVLVTSDGQVFHKENKSFANSHRFKVGGDILSVKKEQAIEKKEEVAIEAKEVQQEEQPKKQVNKPRGRKRSSKK